MHRVNNHRDKSQYLASDYLNILITYLRNISNCTKHLQTIFHKYDENGTDKLDINEFERLLSVLILEACTDGEHDAPNNTELTVSYILNILIQINNNIHQNHSSQTNIEFSQHFVTHLLTHLLSLKSKEHKITSTPKCKTSSHTNLKLKKYKKVAKRLLKSHKPDQIQNTLTSNDIDSATKLNIGNRETNRFRINRRRTKLHVKRSNSDTLDDENQHKRNRNTTNNKRNKSKSRSRSRSQSTDLMHHNDIDQVSLVSSPSNSLVMTENVLFKYQKHKKKANGTKRKCYQPLQKNHFSARLFANNYHSGHNGYYTQKFNNNLNVVSIERIPYHGNGSPSDSTSKSSKSPKNKSKNSKKGKKGKSKHRKKSKKAKSIDENKELQTEMDEIQIPPICTQRGVKISRRRTENNLLSIAREEKEHLLQLNNDHLMLDLLTEISSLQKEHRQSKQCYTDKIRALEQELKHVQSENTVMQQTLRLYEQRIAQMERVIATNNNNNNNGYVHMPIYGHNGYQNRHQIYSMYHPIAQPQAYYNAAASYQNNVSVVSRSSGSSSPATATASTPATTSSHRQKSNNKIENGHNDDTVIIYDDTPVHNEREMDLSNPSSAASNKYRSLEKKLHLKILREREDEFKSSLNAKTRKNASLRRKKKSISSKKFEPIQLQNNVMLNDDDDGGDGDAVIEINPNTISLPLIIDESKTKHHKSGKTDGSYQSISALSGDKLTDLLHSQHNNDDDNESDSNSDIIIVVDDEGEDDDDEKHDYPGENEQEMLNNHKNNILEALQEVVEQQRGKEKQTTQTNTNSNSNTTTSGSNVSSLFEERGSDLIGSDSDCFYLFDDDNSEENAENDDDSKNEPKYTDLMSGRIAMIKIPRSDKDLLKKVKPAYKYHLEMIDDDGSIALQIEQRKRRRDREKQQQQLKQLYSRQQHQPQQQRHNRSNNHHIRMCYFENKPLGFQINESPQCIFVTNVYNDRGTACDKGIERGWKIIEVNKQNNVKGMMQKLRNNKGPFNITFDTNSCIKNYNKMI